MDSYNTYGYEELVEKKMKKTISDILAVLLLTGMLTLAFNSQQAWCTVPPPIQWSRTYGGTDDDCAFSVVQTLDGGYALAGRTSSFGLGGRDAWLIKTNPAGIEEWNKTYGGSYSDNAEAVIQTSDGGYAIGGETESFGAGDYDFWLIKTDSAGNMQWNQTYGGAYSDNAEDMVQTGDGGYAIVGWTESFGAGNEDFWLVKTDSAGDMEWNKTYGGTNDDRGFSVVQTDDGGYAIAGCTRSLGVGGWDFWLVKTDAAGIEEWNQTYGDAYDDYGHCVQQTGDGGYVIGGATQVSSVGGSFDGWLVKTDSTGQIQWDKTFGEADVRDGLNWVIETADGGYALAGEKGGPVIGGSGDFDFWLIKLAGEREPTKWAVIIGVDEYSYTELNMRGGPGNSAKDMNGTLVEYMSFPRDHVHLLVDEIDVNDDTVTRATVESELEWLQTVAIPKDTVVFYYAGHGSQDPDTGHEFIVTHTIDYIQDDEFAASISGMESDNLCVILDTSFSGGFIKDGQTFSGGKEGVGGEWSDLADETPSGRLVLTACAENVTGTWYFGIPEDRDAAARRFWSRYTFQFRYEMVFTHYLVEGFRGRADSNNDGKVTVEEAFWYARDKAYWSPGILRDPFRIHTGQTAMIYDGYPEYEVEGELYLGD